MKAKKKKNQDGEHQAVEQKKLAYHFFKNQDGEKVCFL